MQSLSELGALPPSPRDLPLFFRQNGRRFAAKMEGGVGCRPLPFRPLSRSLGFAVGMPIAEHPPHRSVRAELPHTAPPLDSSVEAGIGIWMKSSWTRDPSVEDGPRLFPIGFPPLTSAT